MELAQSALSILNSLPTQIPLLAPAGQVFAPHLVRVAGRLGTENACGRWFLPTLRRKDLTHGQA